MQCVDVPDADVRELVAQAHLDMQSIWLLTLYTTESSAAVEGGYFEAFFTSIPSMYAPLLEDLRANIEQLPDDLVSRGSRKWEEKHKAGFRELVAVCQSSHFVQTENLTEYRYDYLWNEQFEKATFLLLDTNKPATVRRMFQKNLSSVLKESDRLEDRDHLVV